MQARTYKNKALSALFLMNNVHYMVKAVENSTALAVIGEDWIEQHKDQVRPQTLGIGSAPPNPKYRTPDSKFRITCAQPVYPACCCYIYFHAVMVCMFVSTALGTVLCCLQM